MQSGSRFMTKQSQYLFIKEKLDSYNISTTFPLEMMPLLNSLITKLDQSSIPSKSPSSLMSKTTLTQQHISFSSIEPALRQQVQRTLHSNSTLHMELMTHKEQIQSLKHCIDKMALEHTESSKKDEVRQVLAFCRDKEGQLVQELQLAKFKYNELVDFDVGEDSLQKMYIKKLLNHKKYDLQGTQTNNEPPFNTKDPNTKHSKPNQDLNSRITFKAPSTRKQSRSRINKTIDSTHAKHDDQQSDHHFPQSKQSNSNKLHILQQKLLHRQQQIQRLQTLIRHDGPSLPKLMAQFTYDLQQQQYHKLQERIKLLENQNHQLKQQLDRAKNTGGRYQALIEEVDKSHELISELRKENVLIKRQHKEQQFNLVKEKQEFGRSVMAAVMIKEELKVVKSSDELQIERLKKKVQFYEKELGLRHSTNGKRSQSSGQGKKGSRKVVKTSKSEKMKFKQPHPDSQTQTRNNKSNDKKQGKEELSSKKMQTREKYEDQISITATKSKKQQTKAKTIKQKAAKHSRKLPISQIIEQEDQEESYVKQEPQGLNQEQAHQDSANPSQNNQEQPQARNTEQQGSSNGQGQPNEDQDQASASQSESETEQRNQIMIQQYEQTINELSAKCMQLKEELTSKNQTIKGLEEIANRLMHKSPQPANNDSNGQPENIHHLTHQVEVLSAMLNQSEFQKEELRRQLINAQNICTHLKHKNSHERNSQPPNHDQEIAHLKELLSQKDNKISDMRNDNTTIQDQLLKALDRIRRLNDQIDAGKKQNDTLKKQNTTLQQQHRNILQQLSLNQVRLQEALKHQRERNQNTLELTEVEKDEIIKLRKTCFQAENKMAQQEQQLQALREQNQRLIHQLN